MMAVLLSVFALAVAAAGTHLLLRWRTPSALVDIPNERSNHTRPIPRIGGLAVCGGIAAGWIAARLIGWPPGPAGFDWDLVALCALGIALLSFADDVRSISPVLRLIAQASLVAVPVLTLPEGALAFAGTLPLWLDRALSFFLWLGFLNAYNFMDGIDGISGTVTMGLGGALLFLLPFSHLGPLALPAILIGAAAGFLWFNWHPARIFLGDVGSVPLGFLIGGLLLALAISGEPFAAAILPAYYLTDTGLTLLDRQRRGESVWLAHSTHAYQRAVRRGLPHDRVTLIVAAHLALLVLFAFASRSYPWPSLLAAYGSACLLFILLRTGSLDRLGGVVRQPGDR